MVVSWRLGQKQSTHCTWWQCSATQQTTGLLLVWIQVCPLQRITEISFLSMLTLSDYIGAPIVKTQGHIVYQTWYLVSWPLHKSAAHKTPCSTPGMSSGTGYHDQLFFLHVWTLHHKIFQLKNILNFDLMNIQKNVEYCNFGLIWSTTLSRQGQGHLWVVYHSFMLDSYK